MLLRSSRVLRDYALGRLRYYCRCFFVGRTYRSKSTVSSRTYFIKLGNTSDVSSTIYLVVDIQLCKLRNMSRLYPIFTEFPTFMISLYIAGYTDTSINPFRTAVPLWGQTSQISSTLSPKRDCGSKGVNS